MKLNENFTFSAHFACKSNEKLDKMKIKKNIQQRESSVIFFNINFPPFESSAMFVYCTNRMKWKKNSKTSWFFASITHHTMHDTNTMFFFRCTLCSLQLHFSLLFIAFVFMSRLWSGSREFFVWGERKRERILIIGRSEDVASNNENDREKSLDEGIRIRVAAVWCHNPFNRG